MAQQKSDEQLALELQRQFDEEARSSGAGASATDEAVAQEMQEALDLEAQFEEATRKVEAMKDEKKAKLVQREMDYQNKVAVKR